MKKLALVSMIALLPAFSKAQTLLDTLLILAEYEIPTDTAVIDSIGSYISGHYRTYPEVTKRVALQTLEASERANYRSGQATALRRIGASNYVLGKTAELVDSQLRAILIYEELGQKKNMAFTWNNIGLAYLQNDNPQKAKETFFKALNYTDSTTYTFEAVCYNNLGIAYDDLGQQDSSLYYNLKALDIRLEFHVTKRRLQATYTNLGVLYRTHVNDFNKAIEYTSKAIDINHEISNYIDLTDNYINLGKIYKEQRNYVEAKDSFLKAIQFADSSKNQSSLSLAFRSASDLEELLGNHAESLHYYKKHNEARIKGIENKQKVEIERLENNFVIAQKEKELALLKTEQAKKDLIQTYLIAGIVIAMLLLGLIVLVMRLRLRKSKQEQENLARELEYKNKELTSYALNFIQKNELIGRFSDKIKDLKSNSDGVSAAELAKVGRLLDDSFRIDNEWENFKMMFEEVHKGFFTAIKERYPEIGNSELRLCALLRLNMNLKESSRILGISSDSVKTARYRLRKKLGLSTEENLVDFLIAFDKEIAA